MLFEFFSKNLGGEVLMAAPQYGQKRGHSN